MAHFAELDSNKKVLRVNVVDDSNVSADMAVDGETWCANNIPEDPTITYVDGAYPGVAWKQTSYNHNFRKRFACIDGYFIDDGGNGYFTAIKPHSNWVLSSVDGAYYEPVAQPTVTTYEDGGKTYEYNLSWDQDNTRWICQKLRESSHHGGWIRSALGSDADTPEVITSPTTDQTVVRIWNPDDKSWS